MPKGLLTGNGRTWDGGKTCRVSSSLSKGSIIVTATTELNIWLAMMTCYSALIAKETGQGDSHGVVIAITSSVPAIHVPATSIAITGPAIST